MTQNDSIIVETLLFESNGLNNEENAYIIESTIEYYKHGRVHNTIVMNPFKQIINFLEISNDSGSPYVILFSCLVVQLYIYIYIYIYIYMYVYVNIFHFFIVYIIFIENFFFRNWHAIYLKD